LKCGFARKLGARALGNDTMAESLSHAALEIATTRPFRQTLAAAFPELGTGEGVRALPGACFASRAEAAGSARHRAALVRISALARAARVRAWEIERRHRRDPAFANVWTVEQEDWNVFLHVLEGLMEGEPGDG